MCALVWLYFFHNYSSLSWTSRWLWKTLPCFGWYRNNITSRPYITKAYTFSGLRSDFVSFVLWHTSIHFPPKYSWMFYVRFLTCSGCKGSHYFDCNWRTSVSNGLDRLLFANELNAWYTINPTSSRFVRIQLHYWLHGSNQYRRKNSPSLPSCFGVTVLFNVSKPSTRVALMTFAF